MWHTIFCYVSFLKELYGAPFWIPPWQAGKGKVIWIPRQVDTCRYGVSVAAFLGSCFAYFAAKRRGEASYVVQSLIPE